MGLELDYMFLYEKKTTKKKMKTPRAALTCNLLQMTDSFILP